MKCLQEVRQSNLDFHIPQRQQKLTTISLLIQHCCNFFLFNSTVCSSCKSKRGKLEPLHDNSRRQSLKETFFSKCTHCGTIVSFNTSNISQLKDTEVNVRLVQAELVTENLAVFENFVVIEFTKLTLLTNKNYNI